MAEKSLPITAVVAHNLAYWMGRAKLKQAALAHLANVSQKTVSNYLNPAQRTESATGKEPSGKIGELERIAKALGIEVWQLLRAQTPSERAMYESIEKAYGELRASLANVDVDQSALQQDEAPAIALHTDGAGKAAGKGLTAVPLATRPKMGREFDEPTSEDGTKNARSRNSGISRAKNGGRGR